MPATGKIVLDTSVVIGVLRRVSGMLARVQAADEIFVPLVALGELEYGANLSAAPERQREAVHVFMEGATLLLPTSRTAAEYGRVKFTLKRAGVPLPENDIWIAAAAIEHGLPIATRDAHFSAIGGLSVLDWR